MSVMSGFQCVIIGKVSGELIKYKCNSQAGCGGKCSCRKAGYIRNAKSFVAVIA